MVPKTAKDEVKAAELSPADAGFGYKFGCDGYCVDDLFKAGSLRKGRIGPGNRDVRFCRRSVMEYVATLEVREPTSSLAE